MKKDEPLKVEYWAIARVKPYPANAKNHPPEQVSKIVALIREFGWTKPIVVDERNEILAGHGAHLAARQLGMEKVPVIVRRGLTQAQRRAYRLADNRVGEDGAWDNPLLSAELADLQKMGFDLALTAFSSSEISLSLKPPAGEDEEPAMPPPGKAPVSVPGDIWTMGEHRLICGDSTKPATYKALLGGREAALVFTDPPYGISYQAPSGAFEEIKGDNMRRGQLAAMLQGAFGAALEHTAKAAAWYVWHASATREDFAKALRDTGLVELGVIIWAKPGMVLGWSDYRWAHEPCFYAARQGVKPAFYGDRTQTTTWRVDARGAAGEASTAIGAGVILTTKDGAELYVSGTPPKGRKLRHVHADRPVLVSDTGTAGDDLWEVGRDSGHGKEGALHPTMKPVELARRAIRNSSQTGEIVLDMFAGAGSTIMAAEQTGRQGYGIELDPQYVDATVRRWQLLTGKEATHAEEKRTFEAIAKARAGRKRTARAKA